MSKLLWELETEGSEMLFWKEVALCLQQTGFLPPLLVLTYTKQNLKIVDQILQPITAIPERLLKNTKKSNFSCGECNMINLSALFKKKL